MQHHHSVKFVDDKKKPAYRPVVCIPSAKDFNDIVAMDIKVFDASKNTYISTLLEGNICSVRLMRKSEEQ